MQASQLSRSTRTSERLSKFKSTGDLIFFAKYYTVEYKYTFSLSEPENIINIFCLQVQFRLEIYEFQVVVVEGRVV
jgi:hypothetical protein